MILPASIFVQISSAFIDVVAPLYRAVQPQASARGGGLGGGAGGDGGGDGGYTRFPTLSTSVLGKTGSKMLGWAVVVVPAAARSLVPTSVAFEGAFVRMRTLTIALPAETKIFTDPTSTLVIAATISLI